MASYHTNITGSLETKTATASSKYPSTDCQDTEHVIDGNVIQYICTQYEVLVPFQMLTIVLLSLIKIDTICCG